MFYKLILFDIWNRIFGIITGVEYLKLFDAE